MDSLSRLRTVALLATVLFVVSACELLAAGFAVEPRPTPSPEPPTLCQSADSLGAAVEALREVDLDEVGALGVKETIDTTLEEARQFSTVVGDEFRPLVDDLVASLQDLRVTVDGLGDQATLGAAVASIGESITQIGNAMDALAVGLRTPCPA